MKRALLLLAALPFLIVGLVAVVVGIGVLVPGCMLWPFPRAPKRLIPWAHPGGEYIVGAVDAWSRQRQSNYKES